MRVASVSARCSQTGAWIALLARQGIITQPGFHDTALSELVMHSFTSSNATIWAILPLWVQNYGDGDFNIDTALSHGNAATPAGSTAAPMGTPSSPFITSSPSVPGSSVTGSKPSHIGPIVGGVFGVIVLLALIALSVLLVRRYRRHQRMAPSSEFTRYIQQPTLTRPATRQEYKHVGEPSAVSTVHNAPEYLTSDDLDMEALPTFTPGRYSGPIFSKGGYVADPNSPAHSRVILGSPSETPIELLDPSCTGGLVLWSRSFTPNASSLAASSASPVNSLVRDALIEGRTTEEKYEKDGYSIKWTFMNDLELIFVVAYQQILQLTYVEDFLAAMKEVFVKLFTPFILTFVQSLQAVGAVDNGLATITTRWDFTSALAGWNDVFDKLLRGFESKAAQDRKGRSKPAMRLTQTPTPPSEDLDTGEFFQEQQSGTSAADLDDEQAIAKNVAALKNRLKSRPGSGGRKASSKGRPSLGGSGYDSPASGTDTEPTKRKPSKQMRKWDYNNPTADDMAELDYSADAGSSAVISGVTPEFLKNLVDEHSRGTRSKDGMYEIKDLDLKDAVDNDDTADTAISQALNRSSATKGGESLSTSPSSFGVLGSLFARFTGTKVLNHEDLAPVISAMKDHLMKKNVAKEISEKICEGVEDSLKGKKIGGFNTVKAQVRTALSDSITRILTPNTSTDVLLSIRTKLSSVNGATSSKRNPYTMTFVGVNGVGKSTNLSKVCFWLLQNNLRVLIAACDTFRSGAVEQLRVHTRNLSLLAEQMQMGAGGVELYERGYGKDAAGIAKEAIAYAKENGFDVVLIDTAGRMQDNEPLMRALAKLVAVNNPDKIIFVGEALVGNEAVDQLTKFDRALRDFSSTTGRGRGIDGMLVTKWDTVDDKVGAALSMTYVTGQPIIFVGCGQTYTDLRQLRVAHIVQALMSD
ncbi:hypothetical protein FRB96_000201 [Tulasnella sp. 330]|nr:hypothetical protein FRB96_000201 [Tulasnella sp. 330]